MNGRYYDGGCDLEVGDECVFEGWWMNEDL